MASRRMIASMVVDSDAFLDMPNSTQNLYFHLNVRADDEGFIDNPKKIMRAVGANQNDLEILIAKRYILVFESGVVVIKHWKLHNCIRKDRFIPTVYKEERSKLTEKDNGAYTDRHLTTICQPDDNQVSTICQHRLGKDSIGEVSIVKDSKEQASKDGIGKPRHVFLPPEVEEVKAYCKERKNTVDAQHWHDFYTAKDWMIGKNKMKDWKAAVRTWETKKEATADAVPYEPPPRYNFKED